MKKISFFKLPGLVLAGFLIVCWIFQPMPAFASSPNVNCSNRYVTLVNPVRGRDLWFDQSLKPIQDQYSVVKSDNFSATWLYQYDTFFDKGLMNYVKSFDSSQEAGVFLEVSKKLADDAKVFYPVNVPWFKPNAVFLSGYPESDRKKLIDTAFKEFKNEFGVYPKSVGAWWVDSYSLNYLKQKYRIKTAMIVADQKTTDNYGVWGQWWGVPYYPSKANILTPAGSKRDLQPVAIIQWAQRDPLLAFGEGPSVSNYSLQANDYIRQGKNTDYFKNVSSAYLDCTNPVGQITVGLETGQESIGFINEYENQLGYLKTLSSLRSVTMGEFGEAFANYYKGSLPQAVSLNYENSKWIMNRQFRGNKLLGDHVTYHQNQAFPDYFLADHQQFLDRDLSKLKVSKEESYFPWFILIGLGLFFYFFRYKNLAIYFSGILFGVFSFGLILMSHLQYGFEVFYGVEIPYLEVTQIFLVLVSILISFLIYKFIFKKGAALFLIPLSFFADPIVKSLRYSNFSGKYFLGIATDNFHFLGISFSKPFNLSFVNQDFPSGIAGALLKSDLNKIWNSQVLSLVFYPLTHILIAIILFFTLKRLPYKFRLVVIAVLAVLAAAQLASIFNADPRVIEGIF